MPLIIEGGRVPSRWAEKETRSHSHFPLDQCVSLALVNNMPDPALEDTELQFFDLLDIASGDVPVVIKLYSLTGVPRTDRGQRHLNSFYYNCDELWHTALDGVIITGTEPRQPDLPRRALLGARSRICSTGPPRTQSRPCSRAWPRTPAFSTPTTLDATVCPTSSSACTNPAK